MSFIKTFESFQTVKAIQLFVANPDAQEMLENLLESNDISLKENEGVYYGEQLPDVISLLEENGFEHYKDFVVFETLNEGLGKVRYEGHKSGDNGVEIFVSIDGHKYGYSQKNDDLDIADIARKFEKMLQFSAGRALSWLKKHTVLTSGSKKSEEQDTQKVKESHEEHEEHEERTEVSHTEEVKDQMELRHYMFFSNLKTIKNHIDMMLQLDPTAIDQALDQGHDWAADHLATSKDDIEEVCNWLCNSIGKNS